jgi:hypothetical protein
VQTAAAQARLYVVPADFDPARTIKAPIPSSLPLAVSKAFIAVLIFHPQMHPLPWTENHRIGGGMEHTNGTQKVRRHAHLTPDLIKQLEAIAEENDRSFASQLRTALKEGIAWQRAERL